MSVCTSLRRSKPKCFRSNQKPADAFLKGPSLNYRKMYWTANMTAATTDSHLVSQVCYRHPAATAMSLCPSRRHSKPKCFRSNLITHYPVNNENRATQFHSRYTHSNYSIRTLHIVHTEMQNWDVFFTVLVPEGAVGAIAPYFSEWENFSIYSCYAALYG
jgi:hypothetical protein